MTKGQSKKRTLFTSIISMVLCVAMLVGSTMAWFTDRASVKGNAIQSGTLDVGLEYLTAEGVWEDAEGKTLQFLTADGRTDNILWEPGSSYELPQIRISNKNTDGKGVALSYSLLIEPIVDSASPADLTDVIEFTVTGAGEDGILLPGQTTDPITIKGSMDENAGNEYQNCKLNEVAITVYATQAAYEYDSYGNQYDAGASDAAYYIIEPDENINPAEEFDVYEKHEVYPLNANGGFAVVAEFDGAPGQIYLKRTTSYNYNNGGTWSDANGGSPWAPMAIARVEDPDGNLVALYDFSDLKSSNGEEVSKDIIIDIPEGKAGIWTIRVMNGQPGETFEIGINDPVHWGVRGESVLGKGTTSGSYWLYVQDPAEFMLVTSTSDKFSLYLDGNPVVEAPTLKHTSGWEWFKYQIELNTVEKGAVYEVRLDDGFDGTLIVDGVPGLLCSSEEDAKALKGAWVEEDGILYQGPLQARAREELVKLAANNDLTVTFDKPDELPENIENPIAEAQLFSAYGPVPSASLVLQRQVLDPDDPLCGAILYNAQTINGKRYAWDYENNTYPKEWADWLLEFQACRYHQRLDMSGSLTNLASLATSDLQLNYFYGNEALIKRTVLGLLYTISTLQDVGDYSEGDSFATALYRHGPCFYIELYIEAYAAIAPYLDCVDESACEVLEEGFTLLVDKFGDFRGMGLTNQAGVGMKSRLELYAVTKQQRHLEAFERQYEAIIDKHWTNIGLSEAGYFLELGVDGAYEYMNRTYYYQMYIDYKNLKESDPVLLAKMRDAIEHTLEFEALLAVPNTPQASSSAWGFNHFTSRSNGLLGSNATQPAHEILKHEFPMAARRWLVMNQEKDNADTYARYINDEEWALDHIKKWWPDYDTYMEDRGQVTRLGSALNLMTKEAFESGESVEPCDLPCEREDGFIRENQDGIVAFKHKGIYIVSFYRPYVETTTYYNRQYGGGGMTLVWSEENGCTVRSQEPSSATVYPTNSGQVLSTSIYGTNADGSFFMSGKEETALTWLEKGKSFVISGVANGATYPAAADKTVSWQYDMTETGVDITASLTGNGAAGGEYWINIPIEADLNNKKEENRPDIVLEGNVLTFSYDDGKVMEFSWDNGNQEAKITDIKGKSERMLQIKLPSENTAKISVCVK